FFIFGFRKLMVCPLYVARPAADPAGATKPFGNGLLNVAAGVRKLLFVTVIWVVWLKPSCARIGLVEYWPVDDRLAMVTPCTNIPNPPRMTVALWNLSGLQANPIRGLTRCDVLL